MMRLIILSQLAGRGIIYDSTRCAEFTRNCDRDKLRLSVETILYTGQNVDE